ncbi:MAG: hypothetical protein HUK22_02970, partial [Thermoguttaceae bacterium]|nr:hypothetical protein [Thermoguttaceae bacterium]
MPTRNIYFAIVVILASFFVASKTSLKEQILRYMGRDLIAAKALTRPTDDDLFTGAAIGMADAADNAPYTAYIPPTEKDDYMDELQGKYAGVGMSALRKDAASGEFYFTPTPNSPASRAGLR